MADGSQQHVDLFGRQGDSAANVIEEHFRRILLLPDVALMGHRMPPGIVHGRYDHCPQEIIPA